MDEQPVSMCVVLNRRKSGRVMLIRKAMRWHFSSTTAAGLKLGDLAADVLYHWSVGCYRANMANRPANIAGDSIILHVIVCSGDGTLCGGHENFPAEYCEDGADGRGLQP